MTKQPTTNHPTATVTVLSNGLYRATATNGLATATSVSGRPGSAIAGALTDLRHDYRETATDVTVTRANLSADDVANWVGRSVSCVGANR